MIDINTEYTRLLAEKAEFDAQYTARMEALQNSCQHAEYEIMYYSWRIGSMEPMRFCKACGHKMGGPSDEEVVKFKKDELEETRKTWAKNYPNMLFPKEIEQQYDFYLKTTSGVA
jgi:DNA-binding ferritin-like protein (Dps family)